MSGVNDDSLAQSLLESGILSQAQLEEARQQAEEAETSLVDVLLEKGYVQAADIAAVVEKNAQTPQEAEPGEPSPSSKEEAGGATRACPTDAWPCARRRGERGCAGHAAQCGPADTS